MDKVVNFFSCVFMRVKAFLTVRIRLSSKEL